MKRLWWLLPALVVIALAVFVALAASAPGSRWLVERAVEASGASIELLGIDGTLWRGMRVDVLRIRAGDTLVEAEKVELVPAWGTSLVREVLVLDRLAAASLKVTSSNHTPPSAISVALPRLPFGLDVRALDVERTEMSNVPAEYSPAVRGHIAYDDAGYSLAELDFHAAAYSIEGDLVLVPDEDVAVSGVLTWHLIEPALSGRLELRDSLRALGVALRVDDPAIDARGTVRVLGEVQPKFDLAVTMPEWASERIQFTALAAHFSGVLDHFDIRATAAINVPDLPPAQLALEAGGSFDALDVQRLSLTSDHGSAVAHGRIVRTPEWALDLTTDVDQLDPALFAPTVSGAVSGRIEVAVRDEDVELAIRSLTGRLNGAPFEATGQIGRNAGKWSARDVEVRSGPNHAVLSLEWQADRIAGHARLEMPDLTTLLPDLHGDLSANVDVSGERAAPDITLTAVSKSLRYQEWRVSDSHVDATVKEGRIGDARVAIAQASRNEVEIERINGVVRGSLAALEGEFRWNLADQRGTVKLSARRDGERWIVTAAEGARLTLPGERWRLDRDVTVSVAGAAFSMSPHCWTRPSEQGRVCVESAEVDGDRIRLAGAIDGVEIGAIASRFEDAQRLAGIVAGRWDVAADAGHWRGVARLKTQGLRLIDDEAGATTGGIELPVLSATVEFRDDRAQVSLRADTDASRVVDLELTVGGFDGAAKLDGRATVSIEDLGFIATFTRRVGETGGALNGDFVIGGTVAAPDVRGTLAVANGRIALTEPRVDLTAVELTMQLSGAEEWSIRGSAESDRGSVSITGSLLDPLRESRRFHARVDATDLPMSIPDVTVRLAGGVDVEWQSGLFGVKGRIEIPRAEILLSTLPPGAVAVSEDVVVVNRVETRPTATRAEVDLELVLQDHVHFSAFGLDTGLTGTLRLRQSPDGIVQLNGTLSLVEGSFELYGQKLAIESGRLTYTGPPQDPYVDATASRTIRETTRTVTVRARIQGPARAIETTLFSEPAMSDAETLSYLVLGRPLSSATAQEGSNMMGAAIALGLKGASPVIEEVSSVLGIDELTATGGSTEDLTVVAGKRFSDRVFVRYSYQTFTRMSAILFELMLSRRLALEATAADIPAIDLIYKVGEND